MGGVTDPLIAEAHRHFVVTHRVNTQTGARVEVNRIALNKDEEATATVGKPADVRYLWLLE